ncbi:hypothetical protein PMSM_01135 [Paenibacillus macquariensis subsp. macquariensis]|uniref:transposase n=1 Tax=Paenibacillus macquariensis TaxID=948756 RepID=UPI0007C3C4BA|nr:transposase [Paenibacillus macquariensis]MEC0093427.1 transposase [Paenibacillus macquariensis]OAB38918.1 hypothetical protein PMSM_01135 [Paenibacillus macquariensis subsp. macquariensis]
MRITPFHDEVERLDSIPGIATRMAEQILAEIGTDIKKQFPSARRYQDSGFMPRYYSGTENFPYLNKNTPPTNYG